MTQAYSDPTRADDPHALPDVEIWYEPGDSTVPGYYWHACFPGCLPDGDPFGPYETEALALADAQA